MQQRKYFSINNFNRTKKCVSMKLFANSHLGSEEKCKTYCWSKMVREDKQEKYLCKSTFLLKGKTT